MGRTKTRGRSFLGVLVMWVLVPVALGFVGFYLIGPRIGGVPALKKGAESIKGMIKDKGSKPADAKVEQTQSEPEKAPTRSLGHAEEPEIEVSVEPGPGPSASRVTPTRPRRHRTRTPKRPPVVRPSNEASDPASVDGLSESVPATPRKRHRRTKPAPPADAGSPDAADVRF